MNLKNGRYGLPVGEVLHRSGRVTEYVTNRETWGGILGGIRPRTLPVTATHVRPKGSGEWMLIPPNPARTYQEDER